MTYLLEALQRKRSEYHHILKQIQHHPTDAPPGRLRISGAGNRTVYYHVDPQQKSSHIPKRDSDIARQLAQRAYDQKVTEAIQTQLSSVNELLQHYDPQVIEQLYDDLNPARRSLIQPWILPQEEYIQNWLNKLPTGNNKYPVATDLFTEQGENVRSKSELYIGNKLHYMSIPYRYEVPLTLSTGDPYSPTCTVYPDFTILNPRTRKQYYWEHLGLMDSEEYVNATLRKLDLYIKNGIFPGEGLILTFETGTHTLNSKIVELLINRYLL